MKLKLVIVLLFFGYILSACYQLEPFDCSENAAPYKALLQNHDVWRDQLYSMGDKVIGGRVLHFRDFGNVYVLGAGGEQLQFEHWFSEPYLVLLQTARDLNLTLTEPFGSYGFIYTDQVDVIRTFSSYNYSITDLSDNIYCYEKNPHS